MTALRVAHCDDSGIFRHGLRLLLEAAGIEVVASVGSGDELMVMLEHEVCDAVVLDVRMPPSHTDEGIRLAGRLRSRYEGLGILVLSTYAEPVWASRLVEAVPAGVGYLLKDRVDDARALVDALVRVSRGEVALDPVVVAAMMTAARNPLGLLSDPERRVLALLAEGLSNEAVAARLYLSERTVESHVAHIFRTLGLPSGGAVNRRVQAAVAFLESGGGSGS